MISPEESLLKYDNPVMVRIKTERKSPKGHVLRMTPQQFSDSGPIPPKPKSAPVEETKQDREEILNTILPPREWTDGQNLWTQKVSSAPCTRTDVIRLEELLDTKLQQRQARETGICPVRRELFSQCFDEIIRQVTIICAERGLLLLRIRDEIQMTIAAYQTLYESSIAFGIRKALQTEQGTIDMEKRISVLEHEKKDLMKQLTEQKAQCDTIEKREAEKRQVQENNHMEEIQSLKRSNQQLKAQIDGIISNPK